MRVHTNSIALTVNCMPMGERPDDRDGLFDILGHARRRHMMRVVKEHESVTLADVADEVSIEESHRSIERIDPESITEVYLSLYHVHVPKLVAADLIGYDEERDLLSLTDRGRGVSLHVDAVERMVDRADPDHCADHDDREDDGDRDDNDDRGDRGGDDDRDRHISVQLSLATIEAIHAAIEADDRFDPYCSYDEIIRNVLVDAYDDAAPVWEEEEKE